jgi:hypothetical protein
MKSATQFECYTLAYSPISVFIWVICGKRLLLLLFYFEKWLFSWSNHSFVLNLMTLRQNRAFTQLVSPSYSPSSGREGFLRAIIPEWDFTIDQKTVRKNNLLWKISSCGRCGILKIGADYSVARFKRKQLRIVCHRSRPLRSGILGRMPLDFLFLLDQAKRKEWPFVLANKIALFIELVTSQAWKVWV